MTSKTAGGPFHLILQPHTADLSARIKALTNLTPNVENFPIKGSKTLAAAWKLLAKYYSASQLTEADFVLSIAAAQGAALSHGWEHSEEEAKRTLSKTFALLPNNPGKSNTGLQILTIYYSLAQPALVRLEAARTPPRLTAPAAPALALMPPPVAAKTPPSAHSAGGGPHGRGTPPSTSNFPQMESPPKGRKQQEQLQQKAAVAAPAPAPPRSVTPPWCARYAARHERQAGW